jgi:hypothetical protein
LTPSNQGQSDAFVAKYSPTGDLVWLRQIGTAGTEGGSGLDIDQNDNIIIGGRTTGALGGAYLGTVDTFVAQFSNGGELLWSKQLASRKFERLYDVAVDASDDILVIGHTDGVLGTDVGDTEEFPECPYRAEDAFVARYAPDGSQVWVRQFGIAGLLEGGYGVTADSQQNVIAVGYSINSLEPQCSSGDQDALIVKFAP